jgi:para-nitrobenzyl esterase
MDTRSDFLSRDARSVAAALVLLVCNAAVWADSYNPANNQLTIPYVIVGGATYSNTVVNIGSVVSGPTGTSASGSGDTYDPAKHQLAIPRVMVGSSSYYNVVGAVSGLVSIGSVSGADTYDGSRLIVRSVQLVGGSSYNDVAITIRRVIHIAGGMPTITQDSYDPATGQLNIPAVQVGSAVYTNVTVSVGSVIYVGGSGACVGPTPTIVCTQSGQLQGAIEENFRAFRGIPFAAPPVGALRWRPPQLPAGWQGVRSATAFGNHCPQIDINGLLRGDEDCLTLNIFAVNPPASASQPVMVFVHGGAERFGSAQDPPWNVAPQLASRGVIVVTVEYRLGLLGFLVNPLLTAEGQGSSGNYALMDLIAALRWVHDNISAFGGDPTRVMLFGQSAGSINVQALLASPAAEGLFSAAGMESGVLNGGLIGTSVTDAYHWYAALAGLVNCDTAADVLACLRAVPADTLVQTSINTTETGWFNIEPSVVPEDPFLKLQRLGSPVPLLIGSTSDEMAFTYVLGPTLGESDYAASIHTQFDAYAPGAGDTILSLYPATDFTNPNYALDAVETDLYYTHQTRNFARAVSGAQRPPVWRYLFTHTFENAAPQDVFLTMVRAFHTSELYFITGSFQTLFTSLTYSPSSAEMALSSQMMDYWARFATTGDPNGSGTPQWVPYGAGDNILRLDDDIVTLTGGYRNAQCDFMSTLPIRF